MIVTFFFCNIFCGYFSSCFLVLSSSMSLGVCSQKEFLCLHWRSRWRHYVFALSIQSTYVRANFLCFLCNCLSNWHESFTIGATTHVECFYDNYDVIGHVLLQPCWKKGKLWTYLSPKSLHGTNWNLAHVKYSPCEISDFFDDDIGDFVMTSQLHTSNALSDQYGNF